MFGKTPRWKRFAAIFAVLTVGCMALFFSLYEPWQSVGPDLIQDGAFNTPASTNAWSGWNELTQLVPDGGFGGSPGIVLKTSSNRNGILRFTVYNLTNIPAFRVSLRAAAQGVVRGVDNYYVPRAVVFYQDAKAKTSPSRRHSIMAIPKDTGWRYYKDFFPVPKGAATAHFQIRNVGVAGIMQIDDVSVIPVQERSAAPWWKLFFGTLWTASFGLCLFALRPWARRYGFLIMLTLTLIMTGIVLPGKPLDDHVDKLIRTAKSLCHQTVATAPVPADQSGKKASVPQPVMSKDPGVKKTHVIGHFMLFSLLAFLSALSWISAQHSLRRAAAVFGGLAFFAAATEVLQFIPPDRSAGLKDLRVDIVGMAGAIVLVLLLRGTQYLINRYKH